MVRAQDFHTNTPYIQYQFEILRNTDVWEKNTNHFDNSQYASIMKDVSVWKTLFCIKMMQGSLALNIMDIAFICLCIRTLRIINCLSRGACDQNNNLH